MHCAWIRKSFLRVLKFLQIKEGGPNFWGEPILQNIWIIWSPLLYFNFKSLLDPNSSQFIIFQCILYDSGVLLSGFSNLCKLKRGNQFRRMSELFGPPFSISILGVLWTQISLSFIRFQSILHEWGILFSESWNFYNLKRGDLISGGNQFFRMTELFAALFCILILRFSRTHILCDSWDFSAFCLIHFALYNL